MPTEPPVTSFQFDPASEPDERGKVTVGGDLLPGTLLAGYRAGLFPMRLGDGTLAWWSPDPRAVIVAGSVHVTRSLRRSQRRFTTTVDQAFERVIAACAEREPDEYLWITDEVQAAYTELHRLGWAHSVETWALDPSGDRALVGGLYGVCIGGLFAGESMFHRAPDASKVALLALLDVLASGERPQERIVDVQWMTPHLQSLGAVDLPRHEFLDRAARAQTLAPPPAFASRGDG
jgi:leucyl/phenylalanyl-tRNA---protein transferase